MPLIISVINHKGGVGKTTTTLNLGAGLALKGKNVLLIDLDSQTNLTHSLLGTIPVGEISLCEAMLDEKGFEEIIKPTSTPRLSIVPASASLVILDVHLAGKVGRDFILSRCLKNTHGIEKFDFILIDTPPAVSLSSINALVASNFYITPVSCEYLPMTALKQLEKTIQEVKKINPHLVPLGTVLTMYDKREAVTTSVEEIIREEQQNLVFKTQIRVNTKFKSAPAMRQSIFEVEDKKPGKGSEDYFSLTAEVIARLNKVKKEMRV